MFKYQSNNFLSKINQLDLLEKCFNNIFVPEAVLDELIDYPTPEFDSEERFRALAATGNINKGLEILNKLDAYFSKS